MASPIVVYPHHPSRQLLDRDPQISQIGNSRIGRVDLGRRAASRWGVASFQLR